MQSRDAPRGAGNTAQESTRGIRKLRDRPGRPNPYGVEWAERVWDAKHSRERRQVKKQYFPTPELRDDKFAQLCKARREGALQTLNRREVEQWLAFREATGGTPWQDVVAGWRAHLSASGLISSTTTVAEHVRDYLAELRDRLGRHEVTRGTESHHRHKLKLFAEDFGPRRLSDIREADLKRWLAAQNLAAAGTYNNYRKILSAFFTHAIAAKLRTDNPCATLKAREEHQEEVGILTVPQLAQLFHTANTFTGLDGEQPYRICLRRLALEAFAGVRFSSACRLRPEDINVVDRGIRHPASSIKTRRRQYVEGFPDNLWAWLAIAPPDDDLIFTHEDGTTNRERRYLELKSRLFRDARVPHPHNCLRHSFPTYHLAARQNPGLTAYLLCHRNQQKLWDHYKGNATTAEGKRFETITPETAEALAKEWTEALAARHAAPPPAAPPPPRS